MVVHESFIAPQLQLHTPAQTVMQYVRVPPAIVRSFVRRWGTATIERAASSTMHSFMAWIAAVEDLLAREALGLGEAKPESTRVRLFEGRQWEQGLEAISPGAYTR